MKWRKLMPSVAGAPAAARKLTARHAARADGSRKKYAVTGYSTA